MELNPNVIPIGDYCVSYIDDYRYECPYHSYRKGYETYEDGYCAYLGKGDYELNRELKYWRVYKDGTKGPEQTAEEIGLKMSLLHDQVKMCNTNMK